MAKIFHLNKSTILRNRTISTSALILMLTIATLMPILSIANAQIVSIPNRPTKAYLSVNPPLIGLGQPLTVNFWIFPPPSGPNYEISPLLSFDNLTMTLTKPDGSKDVFKPVDQSGGLEPGQTESSGTSWILIYPNQTGTYSINFSYPGQTYTAAGFSVHYGPSNSPVTTFKVQKDPVQIGLPAVPLPTGYWQRPIEADNREWSTISGNWLNDGSTFNAYTKAPNSAHILWKKDVSGGNGGLIGGVWSGISADPGGVSPPVIMFGKIYYNLPGGQFGAFDLRTGELLWTASGRIRFGQIIRPQVNIAEIGPQTGAQGVSLSLWGFGSSWNQYDASTGELILSIPNALESNAWFINDHEGFTTHQTDWNTTIPERYATSELIRWDLNKPGENWEDKIVWRVSTKQPNGTGPGEGGRGDAVIAYGNVAAVGSDGSDKYYAYDANTGKYLFTKDFGGSQTFYDPGPNGTIITVDSIEARVNCWDLQTGNKRWSSAVLGLYPWGESVIDVRRFDDKNIYYGSYDGYVYALDIATGKLNWKYSFGNTTEIVYGAWAPVLGGISGGGKVYFGTSEHSPTQPRARGARMICLDAITGKAIWNISGATDARAIAEGYLLGVNENDGLLYCFGKGKTETAVSVSNDVIGKGSSVLVKGSVLDMSPAQAGTPAISDADMSAWMNFVHMQAPVPMTVPEGDNWGNKIDVKGVDVMLSAIDTKGNVVNIGNVTSDSNGFFKKLWTPNSEGEYKIVATFAGSESYWTSSAETAIGVSPASGSSTSGNASPVDTTLLYGILVAVIIAIVLALIAIFAIFRKK